jgi:hypothetical protein
MNVGPSCPIPVYRAPGKAAIKGANKTQQTI